MIETPRAGPGPPATVRRAGLADAPVLRALRLAALTEAPEASVPRSNARLAARPRTGTGGSGPARPSFSAGADPKGLVAAVPGPAEDTVWLMAMWVDPALRGSGAADAPSSPRRLCDWARAAGASRVRPPRSGPPTPARTGSTSGWGFALDQDGPRTPESACEFTMTMPLR